MDEKWDRRTQEHSGLYFVNPLETAKPTLIQFLRATAATAVVHFSYRNSLRLSVCSSHWWIGQKRCDLELPNLHCQLPGRLSFQIPKAFP